MEAPQVIRMLQPEYQGVLTTLNADEEVYRARVEEALTGRPELAAEAFIGDPSVRGTQPAVIESTIGILFGPTGLNAPVVLQILDAILPAMLFLAIVGFLGLSGFSRREAVVGGIVFTVLELYNLNRPIHQTASTLVVIAMMNGVLIGLRTGKGWMTAVSGMLLGVLFGMTVWPWTFGWTWWGLMTLLCVAASIRVPSVRSRRARNLLLAAGAFGVLAALPFLLEMFAASHSPAWSDAVFRSGMYPSRLPESWFYSALFTIMTAGTLITVWQRKAMYALSPAIVFLVAVWIVMHQQLVHGQTFNFVSHYLMFMVIAAVMVILLAVRVRHPAQIIAGIAAVLYLAAVGYDGRYVLRQWNPANADWSQQHLAGAFDALNKLPRGRVLSDPETSGLIAGFTPHDVAYSVYLKNVLLTHRQIAARFCLTQLPVPPEDRRFADRTLIYPDALSAFDHPEDRTREIALVTDACAALDADPAEALRRLGFTHVLWDEAGHPEWQLKRLNLPLTPVTEGDGWSLYRL